MLRIQKGRIVFCSAVFIAIALILRFFHSQLTANIFLIAATMIAGYPIAKKAVQFVRLKIVSIELLVTIAVTGAIVINEYMESAVVTFLFLLGAYLESRTLEKTRSSIKELLDLQPIEARVELGGKVVMIPADEVKIGDRVFIHSGEKVPVDGRIMKGQAYMLESAITGESLAVKKEKGAFVFSGTIVDHGYIEIMTEKVGDDTTFSKIIELVEEAQETKAKTQQFLEKFATYYTPAIIILSIIVFLFTRDIHLTLTFLVISCPGALVISAPVSIVTGIGNGARNGILIKGGEIFEKLAKADVIAFDKTGTLTKGKTEVVHIHSFQMGENDLLRRTALAEKYSEHPLGRTIVKEAEDRGIQLEDEVEDFIVEKGKGISAKVYRENVAVGNRKWMNEHGIHIPLEVEELLKIQERNGNTSVLIGMNGCIRGIISISDAVRIEAKETIKTLRKARIKKLIMLTGDNERTAEKYANALHLDNYYAQLLPEEKVEKIKEWQQLGHHVVMVGDGINDAPAIATADIGMAMGGVGTDAAMETADVVLMSDRLDRISYAISLSKATIRNMKQNLFFAVFTVMILLIGVLMKKVFLALGMFIHEISVLIVILNALRLVKYRVRDSFTNSI